MATDDDLLQPGRTFARYQLVEPLGEGAMGAVWKAVQLGLRRHVAIKFLKREAAKTDNARNRFLREGEAAARVHHPNVVQVFDVGTVGGTAYLVMELLEGEELRGLFERTGAMPVSELVDLIVPVCAAVAAAHDEGIVHRDLKPENIFLARTRERTVVPKVVDFGISRVSDDESGRVNTGTAALMGTPRYMSPEQVQGARYVDARTDQYAIGVILYEGATGSVPIDEASLFPLFQRVVAGHFHPPRALRPDLPEPFEQVILRAMATYAERRFPSVRALGAALLPFASERTRLVYADALVDISSTLSEAPASAAYASPSVAPSGQAFPSAATASSVPQGAVQPPVTSNVSTTLSESVRELPTDPILHLRQSAKSHVRPALVGATLALALIAAVAVGVSSKAATPVVAPAPRPTAAPTATLAPAPTPTSVVAAAPRPSPAVAPVVDPTVRALPAAQAHPQALRTTPPPIARPARPDAPHGEQRPTRSRGAERRVRMMPGNVVTQPWTAPAGTTAGGAPID